MNANADPNMGKDVKPDYGIQGISDINIGDPVHNNLGGDYLPTDLYNAHKIAIKQDLVDSRLINNPEKHSNFLKTQS